jgi:hypothetical protein
MSQTESNILKEILLACSQGGARIFRNNTAVAWVGTKLKSAPGTVMLKDARPLHAGLCQGSSDLIGWKTVTISTDMIGKKIAVFTAIEVKSKTGRVTPEQLNFIQQVRNSGGISGIARDAEQAQQIINSL